MPLHYQYFKEHLLGRIRVKKGIWDSVLRFCSGLRPSTLTSLRCTAHQKVQTDVGSSWLCSQTALWPRACPSSTEHPVPSAVKRGNNISQG